MTMIDDVLRLRARVQQDSARSILWGLCMLAANRFGGNPVDALSGAADQRSVLIRSVAVYFAHTLYGLTLAEAGSAVCMKRSGAKRAVARIEEAREDQAFSWKLQQLEDLISLEGQG